jgi:uncharacterized membrane protein YagU involved in acid resistance
MHVRGIEPLSCAWKALRITVILHMLLFNQRDLNPHAFAFDFKSNLSTIFNMINYIPYLVMLEGIELSTPNHEFGVLPFKL